MHYFNKTYDTLHGEPFGVNDVVLLNSEKLSKTIGLLQSQHPLIGSLLFNFVSCGAVHMDDHPSVHRFPLYSFCMVFGD